MIVDKLRMPLFLIALVLIVAVVLVEAGSSHFLTSAGPNPSAVPDAAFDQLFRDNPDQAAAIREDFRRPFQAQTAEAPPGTAIPYLVMLDGLLLFGVLIMAGSFVLSDRVQGRLQGIVTLIVSILILILAFFRIFKTLIELMIMVSLFVSVPFGTIAYLAIWGDFDRSTAMGLLSLLMLLKLLFVGFLVFAHQRFLQNKGLVLLIITSLVANLIVAFLIALVPTILDSITDAIGGIIVAVLALIWAIFFLIGSIISVIKAIRLDRAFKSS
jgi:hypothetical protein